MRRIREKDVSDTAKKLGHPDFNGRVSHMSEMEMSQDYMVPVKSNNRISNAKNPEVLDPVSD